jgi:mannosyltransferase OCH1-like enzyme
MTRVLKVILSFVATILVGTLLVLSTVVVYFGVDQNDVITEAEMGSFERAVVYDQSLIQQTNYFSVISDPTSINSTGIPVQETELHQDRRDDQQDRDNTILRRRIPKIIHQTWKVAEIPQKWRAYRDECQVLHPD